MRDQPAPAPNAARQLADLGLGNFPPYLMNRLMGRYNAALREAMAAQGLTTPQMRSLAVLSVIDGIVMRELAVHAVVPQSTLSRALEPLVQGGLIRRETDAQDSRATRIFLTPAGRDANARLWPHLSAANDAMFAGINHDEMRAFVGTLKTMLRNIRKHDF
jgi:DNA-binding MarR family transcriptional regulator